MSKMLKYLVIILVLFSSVSAEAQGPTPTPTQTRFPALWIQYRDTASRRTADTLCFFNQPNTSDVYYYGTSAPWKKLAFTTGSGAVLSWSDTGRANGKIATAYALNKVKDSLQTNINLKVNISDTAAMLANRLKISDTATAFSVRPLNNRFSDSILSIRTLANSKGGSFINNQNGSTLSAQTGKMYLTDTIKTDGRTIIGLSLLVGGSSTTGYAGQFTSNGSTATLIANNTSTGSLLQLLKNSLTQFEVGNTGIVTTGTWNATAITDTYISSASTWNAKYGTSDTGRAATKLATGGSLNKVRDSLTNVALLLTGGTLTGALNGTSAAFSGQITSSSTGSWLQRIGTSTASQYIRTGNTGGNVVIGIDNSTGGNLVIGDNAYDGAITAPTGLSFSANEGATLHMRIASTGAATFGSTISSGDITVNGNNKGLYFNGTRNAILGSNAADEVYIAAANATRVTIGATTSVFTTSVTATAFYESSDIRLKNVLSRSGDMITFKWKDKSKDEKIHYGYSAQEVMLKMPDAVSKGTDGFLSVNYTEVLVKKVNDLEKRITQLENRLK